MSLFTRAQGRLHPHQRLAAVAVFAGLLTAFQVIVAPPASAQTTPHDRTISLALRKHLVARGRVRSSDGYPCHYNVPVRIQRKVEGDWRTIASTRTTARGLFHDRIRDRAGKYRAVAPKFVQGIVACRRAVSRVVMNA
jgi:hypothetical protein